MPSPTIGSRPRRSGTDHLWERWEEDLSSLHHQCMDTRKQILVLFDSRTIRAQSSTYRVLAASLEIHMNLVKTGPSEVGGKNPMPPKVKSDQDYIYICWQRFTNLCEQGQKLYDLHKVEQDRYYLAKRELDLMKQCMDVLRKDLASYESLLKEAKTSFCRGPYPLRLFGSSPSNAAKVSINRGTQTDDFDPAREDGNPDGEPADPSSPDTETGDDRTCWRGCQICYKWRRDRFLRTPGRGFSSSGRNNRRKPPSWPASKQPAPANDREAQPPISAKQAPRDVRGYRPPSVNTISSDKNDSPRNITLSPTVISNTSDGSSSSEFNFNTPIRLPSRIVVPENVQRMPQKPENTTTHNANPNLTPPFDGDYDVFAFSEGPKNEPVPSSNEKTQPKPAHNTQNISPDIPQPRQGTESPTNKPLTKDPPKHTTAVERMLHNMGYKQGTGLAPQGTGITSPLRANGKGPKDKLTGLGYNRTNTDDKDNKNNNNNNGTQIQNQSDHAPNPASPPDIDARLNAIIQGGKTEKRSKNGGVSNNTSTNANGNPHGPKTTKKVQVQLPLPDGNSKAGKAGNTGHGNRSGGGAGKQGKGRGKSGGGGTNDNQKGGNNIDKENKSNYKVRSNNNGNGNGTGGNNHTSGRNSNNNNGGNNNNNRNNNGNNNNRSNGNVSKHARGNHGKAGSW